MAAVGTLEAEAQKRKERLRELRLKRGADPSENEPPAKTASGDDGVKLPKPVFRSYKPQDEELQKSQLPRFTPTEVKDQVKEQMNLAKPEPLVEEVDLANLAPRKPDWDLKRDVSKKLAKLEKRTQRAIAELIRERLHGTQDLATAVGASTQHTDLEEDD